MTSKKYPVEKATKEKINKLFEYRRLTDLLKASGLVNNQEFVNHLIDVQYQIYMLDAYLESQWDIQKTQLKVYWEAISLSLQHMGFKKKQIANFIREIKDYEKIERDCRKDSWPTKVSFRKFYATKSCDVRLIRHLIYLAHPDLKLKWKEDSWIYYDIITEMNDDISDIVEDLKTYNGNRFLISILRKGGDKTHDQYAAYLSKISDKANRYFKNKRGEGQNKQLAGWTVSRSKETLKLLEVKVHSKIMDKVSQSLLLEHMK